MKKILFLIHALNSAGAQRVLVDLVNHLDPDTYDITVQTIYHKHELKSQMDPRIHVKSIIKTQNPFLEKLCGYLIRRILPLKWVYQIFVKDDYAVEVAYLEGEATRLIAHSTNTSAKKYAWVHTDLILNFTSQGLYKTVEQHRNVYKTFDKVLCVSNGVKKAFGQRFGFSENVMVQYNISDTEKVLRKSAEAVEDFWECDCLKLVTVSVLRSEKRHCLLLKVLKQLRDEGYCFILHVVGDGPERSCIENMVKELCLQDCVRLVGQKMNPYPYMRKSDCLVISSVAEGYSTVAVEACSLAVPVLATDCAGIDEVLSGGRYGIIVPNSEEGLYDGLKRILEDRRILDDYRNLLSASDCFQMKARVAQTQRIFED